MEAAVPAVAHSKALSPVMVGGLFCVLVIKIKNFFYSNI